MRLDRPGRDEIANAPYVVWVNYGYEGWGAHPCTTLEEALALETHGSDKVITKRCAWRVVDESPE